MSTLMPTASGLPSARSDSTVSSSASRPRAMTATRAPSVAKTSATARPMPLLPPVTTAVASASPRSMCCSRLLCRGVHVVTPRHRTSPCTARSARAPAPPPARSRPVRRCAGRASPARATRPSRATASREESGKPTPICSSAAAESADGIAPADRRTRDRRNARRRPASGTPLPARRPSTSGRVARDRVRDCRRGRCSSFSCSGSDCIQIPAPSPGRDGSTGIGVGVRLEQRVEGEHVHGCLQVPQTRRAVPLQQLEHTPVVLVRAPHVAVRDPGQVRRDMTEAVEVHRPEAHAEEVLTLGRRGRFLVHHARHQREHLVHHRQTGFGVGNTGIAVFCGRLRRRARRGGLPHAQRAELGISGHELAQRGGARPGQPDDENRPFDLLVVDRRVDAVGVLHLQPGREQAAPGACAA